MALEKQAKQRQAVLRRNLENRALRSTFDWVQQLIPLM
jgi:hypothetical protein